MKYVYYFLYISFALSKWACDKDLYFGRDDGDRIRPKVTENEAKEARAIVVKAG